ncbi:hypothetical protein EYC98_18145 [Halieaceae bacterium IMCC14734]|uniref:Transposase IS200-like domain-containing protein n=1 Tax=Candidatus Litorirhabdus singularis TaxID=2518993 RepID=A0ABT3TKI1_9GAMM|nr:hypothetical protein [Candidatus Litorirhabdus singularis]MCX2982788.1 hypothetical protein [Candidatus Litorirhabdus singularis]
MLTHSSVNFCGSSWYVALRPNAGASWLLDHGSCVNFQQQLLDVLLRRGAQLHAYALLTDAVHLLLTLAQGAVLEDLLPQLKAQLLAQSISPPSSHSRQQPGQPELSPFSLPDRDGAWIADDCDSFRIVTDSAVLACYRYIDLYPLRAGLVLDPAAWYFSSYERNAYGVADTLVTPHRSYLDLGRSSRARAQAYQRECSHGNAGSGCSGSQSPAEVAVQHRLATMVAGLLQGDRRTGIRCRQ